MPLIQVLNVLHFFVHNVLLSSVNVVEDGVESVGLSVGFIQQLAQKLVQVEVFFHLAPG